MKISRQPCHWQRAHHWCGVLALLFTALPVFVSACGMGWSVIYNKDRGISDQIILKTLVKDLVAEVKRMVVAPIFQFVMAEVPGLPLSEEYALIPLDHVPSPPVCLLSKEHHPGYSDSISVPATATTCNGKV